MMSAQTDLDEKISTIYTQLFHYKNLLEGAPEMTIDPNVMAPEMMPTVAQKTKEVIAFLLGLKVEKADMSAMIASVNKNYAKDDFWRRLIVSYLSALNAFDKAQLKGQEDDLRAQINGLRKEVSDYRQATGEVVARFADAVEKEKFPINAGQLFRNYFKMAESNFDEAWKMVTSNPAFFAPIKTTDANGNRLLTPHEAREQNERLGLFIKRLKV